MFCLKNKILLPLLTILIVGCTETHSESEKHGYLKVHFSETKAMSTDNFVVSIHSNDGDARVFSSIYSKYPDLLELSVGAYTAKVRYPSEENYEEAKFEQPFFSGNSGTAYINEDNVTEINEIPVTIQNMLVSVQFDESIKKWFSTYSVEVSIHEGADKLVYNELTTTVGYFSVAPLTIRFKGVRVENENDLYEVVLAIIDNETIQKAAHHQITISGDYVYPTDTKGDKNEIVHQFNLAL